MVEQQHILSFDLENWYDGNLHRRWTGKGDPADPRLLEETYHLLDLLDEFRTRATFFILGRVAMAHPELVRHIAQRNHEIGSHALDHLYLRDCTPAQYLDGLRQSRSLLQDLSGQPVLGHRAPSWSVDRRVPWAAEVLLEAGFTYDSSIFPMRTPLYGEPTAPTTPFWLSTRTGHRLLELPPAVRHLGAVPIPYSGGIYWRVLPAWLVLGLLRSAISPQVTYLHPWELNPRPIAFPPGIPAIPRLVLRYGVRSARAKLRWLLRHVSFCPVHILAERVRQESNLPTFSLAGV